MVNATAIRGRKGGGSSSRTPTEQPDDLQSVAKAKILIALGEGEFSGQLSGKNIYLDGTPLENADGSQNFSGVAWEFRSGTQAQQYIQGIPGTENEITVGTEVSSATAWTRTFTNTQLSAVRLRLKWPSLFKQENDGDLVGYSINYAIDLQTDGGTWQTVLNTSVTGKTTSGYERSHRIDLPQAGSGWTIRLRKITADANSAKIGDTMTLQSFTEVIDAKLRYPNTALLYIEFDSSQFNGSIPQISCEPRGRVIRVPDTYNPETRTYTGTWTGSFKWAWTDNPAWIFYDLVVSDRFGLGHRLTAANIDKWTLYQVAQYCDQLVPDGKGGSGTEPRYICNVYIQDRNDAYTVLRDFAAIFRGMTYWGGDQIVALADMPRDVDYSYTRANVVDGRFTYSSSTAKTRYTTALVSWSDPSNAYADAMEPVFEQALVARYGFNQLEMTAIGCTGQSEANRKGRWGILTNNKDRVVSFDVGLDGNIPQPGYIIAVADEMLSGKVTGGRISAVNGRVITLDRAPDAKAGHRLIINLPSGASQARTIQAVNGKAVTVSTAYSETPQAESVWVAESDELYAQQYRVISISDNNDGTFTVTGAAHDPDKYARIDTGAIIDQRPVSVIPPGNQFAPVNIIISSYSMVNQGISIETMRASWDPAPNAIAYEAQWRRNDGNWVNVPRSSTTSFEVAAIYAGRYLVRVRAINAAEISSSWATSLEVTLTGKTGAPPVPINFRTTPLLWGVQLDWDFPANTADTLQTEIQYSTDAAGTNAMLLTDVPYPQHMYQQLGLKAGVGFWYRARLIDRTGNQSAWTDFIQGSSSSVAADYLVDIDNQIKQTDAYKELTADIADLSDDIQSARDDISKVTTESAATKAGLAQEVTDRKKAITDEATARAQALLTEKNERVADISNVNQTIQTTTESLAQQIGQISAGTGSQFDPAKIWYFDSTVEGWTGNGSPTIVDGWIRPANHATDPWVASPGSLGVNSSSYRFVKLRIRKFGAPGWAGQLRWRGTGGFNDTNMLTVAEPAYDANGIATLEFDNIPWLTETTMNQFRLDLSTKQDATNFFLIDWVALGRPTPGAGMAALQAETTARVAGDQAEATARETLATQIRGGYAGDDPSKLASGLLYTERQARITAQEAEVTERKKLESTVNTNQASVTQELATLTTEQEAQATTLSGLQVTVGKNTADITTVTKAVADNNKAQTTALAAVKATTDQNTADISTETMARTDGDSALGRRIDSLKVDVDGNTASRDAGIVGSVSNAIANFFAFSDQRVTFAVGETKTQADITETRKTAADATSAVAEQVTTLKATVEQNGQTNAAAITRIDKAVTDLESATATSIQQVTASIGQTNANVQTTSQAVVDINGKLSAQWGVKVQVEANGVKRIAGIQLGIDGAGASNFLISADTFAVYNPTTNGQELVFASTGGQMFMRSVFIQDGSIDNGKIGNYIQSSNWDGTGNVGWHINKSGYATFNGVTVRGTIYATDGSFRGRVEATSGSFKGTVEATSFIGDVANTGVYPDSSNRSNNAVSTSVAMAYTDSSNNGLNKNAVVEALIYVRGTTGAVGSTVNLTIAGNVRTFTFDVPVGGFWFTARHAVTGLTGQRIDASIFVSSSNATVAIYAPTITVTRGTGSFS
ncbi:DUF1983 domain-containing protein [Leclercia adecarboxylata]|uniref:DUF1983 domain-containing protein n=1 Tax=Leclercia adecarboxylata TaxID=83655 RepID=A0AAP9DE66_9ENTR|nr:DUF1983 domain-containing protein [Leclercia adecarboxylata]QDK21156.1 DUF1983 domain-containing protein [Leclercia adecarboxylata]